MNALPGHPASGAFLFFYIETVELSQKPRLGKILTGKVADWKKAAANDCYVGENFEISVRRASGDRFTAKDPLLFAGKQANLYGYVANNPINWNDPLGLEVQLCKAPANIAGGAVDHWWIKTDSKEVGVGGNEDNPGEK